MFYEPKPERDSYFANPKAEWAISIYRGISTP